jgi:hypothetical protein
LDAILYQECVMPYDPEPTERLATLFTKEPCWKIEPLASELSYSVPSVRRFLAEVGYFSSFTHNGAWYTLRSIPRFGEDGLWFHKDIGFSRAGSLTKTLVDLATRGAAGMTAEQLGAKLRCRCHSVLVQLCRQRRLQRHKIGSSHVYLATDPLIAAVQRQSLESLSQARLPAEIAVLILVEFIRNTDSSFEQLAQAIRRNQGITVHAAQIEELFDGHGLKKRSEPGCQSLDGFKRLSDQALTGDQTIRFVSRPRGRDLCSRKGYLPMWQSPSRAKDSAQESSDPAWTLHRPRDGGSM